MKKVLIKSVLSAAVALITSNAFAGGGGSGWTQCNAKELGYIYSFSGYTQNLNINKVITVFTNSSSNKDYAVYKIDFINLSSTVGIIELSYVPDKPGNVGKSTDFGKMKIEYFSNSALKDIKVTFTKDGADKTSNVNCMAD